MDDIDMAKYPGLTVRPENGRFYIRVVIPQRLRAVAGRRDIRKSLDTSDRRVAIERYRTRLGEAQEQLRGYEQQLAEMTRIDTAAATGSVLFSSRAPIGYCAIAANPVSTNQGFKSWVCEAEISPEFVRFYLLSATDYADSLASGTTFREVSGKRVGAMAFPLPPLKGIIIDEPWISEILAGRKSWEMRGKSWSHRGEVALIRKGSGLIVGLARMTDCLERLDEAGLRRSEHKHRIPPQKMAMAIENRWMVPWVLEDVQRLAPPIPYVHKFGAQTPVNIDEQAQLEVRRRISGNSTKPVAIRPLSTVARSRRPIAPPQPPPPLALQSMTGEQRAQAMHALPHFGGKSVRSITMADIPTPKSEMTIEAAPSVDISKPTGDVLKGIERQSSQARKGAKLRQRRILNRRLAVVRATVSFVAGCVVVIGLIGWAYHLVAFGLLQAFSMGGLKWFLSACAASIVVGALSDEAREADQ
ncbi:DUF6538 domain-containing protein [Novosphingobium sp. ZN18A2]|uniref:DUF6538 domain-containing protein n=1 Tax=Novosphingobium sp. ZN18A2 TaxID=3079861 RepID=UPI0030D5EAB1